MSRFAPVRKRSRPWQGACECQSCFVLAIRRSWRPWEPVLVLTGCYRLSSWKSLHLVLKEARAPYRSGGPHPGQEIWHFHFETRSKRHRRRQGDRPSRNPHTAFTGPGGFKTNLVQPCLDPHARLLRFQLANGSDYPHTVPSTIVARHIRLRPLLIRKA